VAWQISRFSVIRLSPGRTTSSDIGSGDVGYRVISQGQGLALWQRRIGTGRCERVGLRIPDLEVLKQSKVRTIVRSQAWTCIAKAPT
jgi:hypothetical protein